MNQELEVAMRHEEKAQEYLRKLKENITTSIIEAGPIAGVRMVKDAGPSVAIVSSNALLNWNLSPDTYIPKAQSDAVARRISTCATVRALLEALQKSAKAGYIRFSNGEQVTLNTNTLKVLASYLE